MTLKPTLIRLTVLGTLLLGWVACSPQKVVADRPQGEGKEKVARGDSSRPSGPITYIQMSRTGCYGTCPVYSTEIQASGMARYSGLQFTDMEGVFEKQLPVDQVDALFQQFKAYGVDSCQELYPSLIQDLPGLHFDIVYASQDTQRIRNAHFGPPFLKELGKKVDELAKPDFSWKKIAKP